MDASGERGPGGVEDWQPLTLIDALFDPVVVLAPVRDPGQAIVDFRCTAANAAACAYSGLAREQMIGSLLLPALPADLGPLLVARCARVVMSGEPLVLDGITSAINSRSGDRRYDIRARRAGSSVLCTWRDVTEQHDEQRRLAEAEARYRILAENAADIVAMGSNEGTIEWMSPTVTDRLGWAVTDLVGRPFAGLVHPEDLAALRSAQQAVLAGQPIEYAARIRACDGTYRWFAMRLRPVFDEHGEMVGRAAGMRDITDQREAATAREEAEERFRLMVENATDVVFHTIDGIVQWMSPSVTTVAGWSVEEMVGHSTAHLWHPDDRDEAIAMRDATYAGVSHRGRLRFQRKDGTYVWLDVALQPQPEPDGRIGAAGFLRDVDREVRAQQALERSERRFRILAENAMDLVFSVAPDGSVSWVSPSVSTVLGFAPEEVIGQSAQLFLAPEDLPKVAQAVAEVAEGRTATERSRFRRKEGEPLWMEVTVRPMLDATGDATGRIVVARDVDAAVRSTLALAHELEFDSLTGLAKRSVALERIQEILDTRKAPGWALLAVGADGVTLINQAYTYAAGDAVLRVVAERLVAAAGAHDRVARIAGDEFVVLLRDIATPTDAARAARRILATCNGPVDVGDARIGVTVSVGIATPTDDDAEDLLRDAIAAMRQASSRGPGRWDFLDGDVGEQTRHALAIRAELEDALAGGAVTPWFMPIVSLPDRRTIGFEALARWTLDDGATRSPAEFIPVAERTGLIVDLDRAMIRGALDVITMLPRDQHIAVNVSAVSLVDGSVEDSVRRELARTGVDAQRLHLEVTETALLRFTDRARTTMAALADLGIAWWVDDFGTGYSSITHLRDLPLHGLKLDLSFTAGLSIEETQSTRLAHGLAGLAHGLGLATLAEGVETREQERVLIAQGWQQGQGWLYGKPLPFAGG